MLCICCVKQNITNIYAIMQSHLLQRNFPQLYSYRIRLAPKFERRDQHFYWSLLFFQFLIIFNTLTERTSASCERRGSGLVARGIYDNDLVCIENAVLYISKLDPP